MEKQKKISMFTRMYSAITDFRIYPFVQREKLSTAISYFLKLIALIVLAITCGIVYNTYAVTEKIAADYNTAFPEFIFKNGELSAEKSAEYSYGDGIIILDTNYNQAELKEVSKRKIIGYNYYTLISKDALNVYVDEFVKVNVSVDDFARAKIYFADELVYSANYPLILETFDKTIFFENVIEPFNEIQFKICFFIETYIGIFLAYISLKVTSVLAAMILVTIFNFIFGNRLKFGDVFKIVAYALTLPMIVETVALVVTGSVSESVAFIYQLLVCIYVFYALRAIKLDKIIITATNNGVIQKIINQNDNEGDNQNKADIVEERTDEEKKNDEQKNKED